MNREFYGKIVIEGEIEAVTGLHIGAQRDISEIGGIDNPVIKDPHTGLPYIPGSSLKGRLRSLFEIYVNSELNRLKSQYPGLKNYEKGSCRKEGKENCGKFFNRKLHNVWIHVCNTYEEARNCPVCRLFGASGKESNFPSRVIVRDAFLTEEWKEKWRRGEAITEAKIEVGIDRITSQANPRTTERVVAGAKFNFEIIYTVEDLNEVEDDLKHLLMSMLLLEDSYLGGSGSRGYGKVKFHIKRIAFKPREFYETGDEGEIKSIEKYENVRELLNNIKEIVSLIKPQGG